MKIWIKISSENRVSGAWFYDIETARQHARHWEMLIPVEWPNWPNDVPDDATHIPRDAFSTDAAATPQDESFNRTDRDALDAARYRWLRDHSCEAKVKHIAKMEPWKWGGAIDVAMTPDRNAGTYRPCNSLPPAP